MKTTTATNTGVSVQLSGQDGNVFSIIGRVSSALKRKGFYAEAEQFKSDAMKCGSYDEVLQLAMSVADVS